MKRLHSGLFGVLLPIVCMATGIAGLARAQEPPAAAPPVPSSLAYLPASKETYLKFATEVDDTFNRDILAVWFPRALDNEHGGFHSNFNREWKSFGQDSKFSVLQGRQTWVSAQIAMRRPELKEQFLPYAKHGIDYLTGTLWDKEKGGFYWGLAEDGGISPYYSDGKQLYGMSLRFMGWPPHIKLRRIRARWSMPKKGFTGWRSTRTTPRTADIMSG